MIALDYLKHLTMSFIMSQGQGGGAPRKFTHEFIEKEADAFEEWMARKDTIWYEDFAFERGYDSDYLREWAQINEKFRGTYKRSQARQKSLLIRGGLVKKFQYNMCALLLGHSYGIVAKQETKHTGDSVHSMLDEINGKTRDIIDDE